MFVGVGVWWGQKVAILVVEQGFDALYERVCFSLTWLHGVTEFTQRKGKYHGSENRKAADGSSSNR